LIDGKRIYHCGDTGVFLDMQLISGSTAVRVCLIPIGDNTMGIDDAVRACEMIRAKLHVPITSNTFPVVTSTATTSYAKWRKGSRPASSSFTHRSMCGLNRRA
jgi:L-ascorbate metabolism protein UlaG (beta-lactamase superfamily)